MKSVRVKMGEIGMRGTPKHAVACDFFCPKEGPSPITSVVLT